MTPGPRIADERGTTLVELMVGLAAGMVVLAALTMVIVVTLHGSARVSARVESTQRARIVLTQIMEELHSACVSPQIAPIKPESTGSSLVFIHATGSQESAVSPTPTKSVIAFENGLLAESDFEVTGGSSPNWTFSETASGPPRQLLAGVSPITPGGPIFTYYKYENGALSESPQPTPLGKEAAMTIDVQVALTASPTQKPVADAGADTSVQDSAVLRLTPPSFNEEAVSLPCQ
jgi:hypothetical protein